MHDAPSNAPPTLSQGRQLLAAYTYVLDEGPLARQQFSNLRVYKGPNHPHEAQKPETLDVGALNPKNKRVA